jgi:serine phosphatase RsbU (regulator of sigma subunit)
MVSGDFYDFIELSDGKLGIVVADVADKGVPAAIFMALSRTVIRTTAVNTPEPSQAMEKANNLITSDNRTEMFLTAFYGVLDSQTGELRFANGGHNRPMWLRNTANELSTLTARGTILGAFSDLTFEEGRIQIEPGDVVVFYTDGVTEAMNPQGDIFTEERLCEVLTQYRYHSAAEIEIGIIQAVRDFVQDAPQSDDYTMVVLKRE